MASLCGAIFASVLGVAGGKDDSPRDGLAFGLARYQHCNMNSFLTEPSSRQEWLTPFRDRSEPCVQNRKGSLMGSRCNMVDPTVY